MDDPACDASTTDRRKSFERRNLYTSAILGSVELVAGGDGVKRTRARRCGVFLDPVHSRMRAILENHKGFPWGLEEESNVFTNGCV